MPTVKSSKNASDAGRTLRQRTPLAAAPSRYRETNCVVCILVRSGQALTIVHVVRMDMDDDENSESGGDDDEYVAPSAPRSSAGKKQGSAKKSPPASKVVLPSLKPHISFSHAALDALN
jgi:hypothetical protein